MAFLKHSSSSSSQTPKTRQSLFGDGLQTTYDNRSDNQRYQDWRLTEHTQHTQLQIHADDLDRQLGICVAPGNECQNAGNNQDLSFWPAWSPQWNVVDWKQPPDVDDGNKDYPILTDFKDMEVLDEQSDLFCTASERVQSNQLDAIGFSGSETLSFQYEEPISLLLQPDAAVIPSEVLTSDLNHSVNDNYINSEIMVDDRDLARMGCWDESLMDMYVVEQPLSIAEYDPVPADIFAETFWPPDMYEAVDSPSRDNFDFCSKQFPLRTLSINPSLDTTTLNADAAFDLAGMDSSFDLGESPSQSTSYQGLNHGPQAPLPILLSKNRHDSRLWKSPDKIVPVIHPPQLAPRRSRPLLDCSEPAEEEFSDQHVPSSVFKTSRVLEPQISRSSCKKNMKSSKPLVWDNTAWSQFKRYGSVKDSTFRPAGRRKGKLKPEQAEKAKDMRILRACLLCSLSKAPCSPGEVCDRCAKMSSSILRLCTRARLGDYSQLFFPKLLSSHLQEDRVQKLEYDLCSAFVDNSLEVDILCGKGHLPMRLQVTEFIPTRYELSSFPIISSHGRGQVPGFENKWPSPVALRSVNISTLMENCRCYVTAMVRHQNDLSELLPGELNRISHEVLGAVGRYHSSMFPSSQATLLEKALSLYTMHRFMGWTITLTEESLDNVANCLRRPTVRLYETNLVSRLLNSQVKSAMLALLREVTQDILDELERQIKSRERSAWTVSFSVISILCICMENVQIAIDGFTMHNKILGRESNVPALKDRIEACRNLDDMLFDLLTRLFHEAYKSNKPPSRSRKGRAYNPIRDGVGPFDSADQGSFTFVEQIRHIISANDDCISKLSETPSFDRNNDTPAQHLTFRRNNSARLLSRFLKSFRLV